jgi:hypothetical protein
MYDRFMSQATYDPETKVTIWRGKLIQTADDLGLPAGTYKRVMDALTDLQCVEMLERGMRGQLTSLILHAAPTDELWTQAPAHKDLTRPESSAILSRRVQELERRLEGFDVKQGYVELQRQVSSLQDDVNFIKQQMQ